MDKALLVGINKYKNAPLNGCVNDVSDMANLLVDRYGFKPENVSILVDERATKKRIIKRLKWLTQSNVGDRCLFHFSGHGTQYPTRNYRHEVDGLLEVICPYNFEWRADNMITDKELVKIFKKMPRGVKFNWIADCCHSGDLTRGINEHQQMPRMHPVPVDIAWRQRCILESKEKMESESRAIINGELTVGFISGCKSNQTSADARISGRPCGAFTHFLIRALNKYSKKTPINKIA